MTAGFCHSGGPVKGNLVPFITDSAKRNRLGAELYIMMDSDVKNRISTGAEKATLVVQYLSGLCDSEVVAFADEMYRRFSSQGVEVIAIATYLPEIVSDNQSTYESAIKAVANVCKFAVSIGASYKSRIPVVELVCGSITDSIRELDGDRLEVPIVNPEVRRQNLLNRLAIAFDSLNVPVHQLPEIALELEPGKLFLLSGPSQLDSIAKAIAGHKNKNVATKVGFNLDFAHWWIAGIDINEEFIQQYPLIVERIKHCHISGHAKMGHFGDFGLHRLPPETIATFKRWLTHLARDIAPRSLGFSGCVSVELEAAYSMTDTIESVETLIEWLEELPA
jgi:sugar phosphate isomerase/epimerase